MDIAEAMADKESLWVPVALFEGRQDLVEQLIGLGVLVRAREGTAVGFAHQTLFEHAWARAFARGKVSLADYTLARQHGLFVRPTLWAGLTYLRGADPAGYRREFARLWQVADLRPHVRHLLLEFLGQVTVPDLQEQQRLLGALGDTALRPKVLTVIRGNQDWFALLAPAHLPSIMRTDEVSAGLVVPLLASAWNFARDTTLALLRDNWLPDPRLDSLTYQTLTALQTWLPDVVDIACAIFRRSDIHHRFAVMMATQAAGTVPHLAPSLVAAGLARKVAELERLTDPPPEPLPENASQHAQRARDLTHEPKRRFEEILEDREGWHGLEEIATPAPQHFLREVWPLFRRLLQPLVRPPEANVCKYRDDSCLRLTFASDDEEGRSGAPMFQAIDLAIRLLAQQQAAEFLTFLAQERDNEALAVQRLLARGLAALAASDPTPGVQFLTEDPRRLTLGLFSDEHEDTLALIQALVPHCTPAQIGLLETAIQAWDYDQATSPHHPSARRQRALRRNRQHRLKLLHALPFADLTPSTQALVRQDDQVFPGHQEAGVHRSYGGWIGSPMTAEEMAKARDDDILNLFAQLTDGTEHHPKDWMKGGSAQASQEFARFAKSHPNRAMRIVRHFQAGQQERPAGAALVAVSETDTADEEVLGLLRELAVNGFCSEEFRVDVARCLERRLKDKPGLPDDLCNLLEQWLALPWTLHETDEIAPPQDAKPHSVLWHASNMVALPFGAYYLLHVLTYAYLQRQPRDTVRWLTALEAHLQRPEVPRTWQVLAYDLRHLRLCDHGRAARFLDSLFDRFPTVLASEHGALLLPHVWHFVPTPQLWDWFDRVRDSSWRLGALAYGELLTVRALEVPEDVAAQERLQHLLQQDASLTNERVLSLTGIAFACVHLWTEPPLRHRATELLVRLLPLAEATVAGAVMRVFALTPDLPPDAATRTLLEALVDRPAVLAADPEGYLVARLARLLPHEAELVGRLTRATIRIHRQDVASLSSPWSRQAADLTTIALTLHRLNEPHRRVGLELFEDLLTLRVTDAEAALRELDQRLQTPGMPSRPLRRRR